MPLIQQSWSSRALLHPTMVDQVLPVPLISPRPQARARGLDRAGWQERAVIPIRPHRLQIGMWNVDSGPSRNILRRPNARPIRRNPRRLSRPFLPP